VPVDPHRGDNRAKLAGLLDALEGEVVLAHAAGNRVLDLGHGSAVVATWVRACAGTFTALDAAQLGEDMSLTWQDDMFDVIYCLRTFAHLGQDADSAERAARALLAEAHRVLTNGGRLLVEIENPRSLRGVNTLGRLLRLVPDGFEVESIHGILVAMVSSRMLELPLVGRIAAKLEFVLRDAPGFRRYGGKLLVGLRKIATH